MYSLSAMNFALKLDNCPIDLTCNIYVHRGRHQKSYIHMEGMYSDYHEVKSAHEN